MAKHRCFWGKAEVFQVCNPGLLVCLNGIGEVCSAYSDTIRTGKLPDMQLRKSKITRVQMQAIESHLTDRSQTNKGFKQLREVAYHAKEIARHNDRFNSFPLLPETIIGIVAKQRVSYFRMKPVRVDVSQVHTAARAEYTASAQATQSFKGFRAALSSACANGNTVGRTLSFDVVDIRKTSHSALGYTSVWWRSHQVRHWKSSRRQLAILSSQFWERLERPYLGLGAVESARIGSVPFGGQRWDDRRKPED